MNVWEQKRKEREQQRANAFGPQQQGNNGQQGPIVINSNAQQMNPSALGINISSKTITQQPATQMQNNSQQQHFNQPSTQQQYQSHQQQQPPKYNQQPYENNKQQPDAKVQKYVDFEPSLPSNTREKEMDRYERGARPLDFNSQQPKPKQITEGDPELFVNQSKKKPSEMNDEEYAEYEKRQIRNQQMRLIKSVVWNPKASNFDKREVDELLKVDAVFKKMYEEELRKKEEQERQVEQEKQAEQRRNEERERRQAELDRQKNEPQTPPARQYNAQQQQYNSNYQQTPPQQQQMYNSSIANSGMYGSNMNNGPYGGYGNMQQPMQQQGGYGGGNGYYPPQQQYGVNNGYNGYNGYQQPQQQNPYGQQQNRQYYQNANAPSERDFFQLQDELKMLREQLRRYELDNQQNEKTIRDLQYQLNEEKRVRQQTERALLDAQRDMEKYTAEIGAFQRSLKEGKPYNPQLPQMPQGGYMSKYQQGQQAQQQNYQAPTQYSGNGQGNLQDVQQRLPQQQFAAPSQPSQVGKYNDADQIVKNVLNLGSAKLSNRPGSGTLPQVLPNQLNPPSPQNQVDKVLNNVNEILDAYPAGAQTIARVKSKQNVLTQQGASSNMMGPNDACMRTLQADSSLIEGSQTMKRQQDAELQRLLNQDDNYNTMQMERPPDDVPPSLLESIEPIKNRLPSARYQPGGFK